MLNTKLVKSYKTEILSGLTVALALVPEAIAFAFVADLDPLVGLYAAFIIGLITSVFGGRPGMISGATGALAVVMAELFHEHPGTKEYLFLMVIIMGVFQILFGVFKLGKLVRLIPEPVMFGFVNGLAIVIFKAQFGSFKIKETGKLLPVDQLITMGILIVIVMSIIHFLPKLTKAVPPALAAIVISTLAVSIFKLNTATVGDVASVAGGFPVPHLPAIPKSFEIWGLITKTALVLASVGLIESLMTLTLIDERTKTRGKGNKESIAQGLANVLTGLFGGMGGCAMIGQSMINVKAGGKTRVSSFVASMSLLGFILFGSGLIERIPVAVLVGVMFSVVIATFEWSSFRIMKNIKISEVLVIIAVTGITIVSDLAVAVVVGVIMSALVFAWEKGSSIDIERIEESSGQKIYHIRGAIFFASVHNFLAAFKIEEDCDDIIIDLLHARIFDHSGIEALNTITARYKNANKTIHLRHLSSECFKFITDSKDIVEVNLIEDPNYHVALDKLG